MAESHSGSPLLSEAPRDVDIVDEPLLKQLPAELREYILRPSQTGTDKLEYTDQLRSGGQSNLHKGMVALGMLCCCYSACKTVMVRKGELALIQNNEKPELLGPGRHVLLSPFNHFVSVENVTAPVIQHGPLHIIRVEIGQLGYGMNLKTGRPVFLSRGKHVINDIHFVWRKFINMGTEVTQLDQLSIIRIETGYVGYAYKKGNLCILKPGLHCIEPPDRYGDKISTQMQIIDMDEAVHETSDYVPVAIKAAIFFRIVDAEKALRRISNIKQQITETAVATLAGIIRCSSLSDIASRSQPFYHKGQGNELSQKELASIISTHDQKKEKTAAVPESSILPTSEADLPSAPPFFQHVHDQFITQLHDHTLEFWGIEIHNIRIEALKIFDPSLQTSISNQSIDVSKQHNKYLMLQKQQEIVVTEARSNASQKQIAMNAQASTVRAQAQAHADRILINAKADKEAIVLKAEGEAEYARLLSSTKLGNQMSVMRVQAETLQGLNQVAYVPHLPNLLGPHGGIFSPNN
eukprot:CAMPEP_0202692270 /NCGR_PEP_ID=MMETSP1385-20130828/6685_1 /ASSEMBLY_ACC=CAM_ASM_000861 /TAXON_ID=933848 /ORGANISM="Elphidium margaritaceum" /LENGTH=521 /DNA_ID=CAMNT_0049347765 /DNA_START=36 /DNA_END=1601 /DNA_ORIENTATION=-